MTNCWSEGALRAYLDRELPPEDMKAVSAHLGECSSCDALCAELSGRAARVFALLDTLGEPEPALPLRPVPVRTRSRWLGPGAAAALAAGLAIASWLTPKPPEPVPVQVVQVPAPVVPALPLVVEPEATAVREPAARPAAARTVRSRRPSAPKGRDYFLALDDEPIESGVIMRVAVEPGNTQADIVFDPGGRARAIRLVSGKY